MGTTGNSRKNLLGLALSHLARVATARRLVLLSGTRGRAILHGTQPDIRNSTFRTRLATDLHQGLRRMGVVDAQRRWRTDTRSLGCTDRHGRFERPPTGAQFAAWFTIDRQHRIFDQRSNE